MAWKRRLKLLLAEALMRGGKTLRVWDDPSIFEAFQQHGYHLTPNHYYQPVPDTRRLDPQLFTRRSELPGLRLRLEAQQQLLEELASRFGPELDRFPHPAEDADEQVYLNNGSFGPVDAELLHGMIRRFRPRQLLEIGSGFSTRISARAARWNAAEGAPCSLTAFEPFPAPWLQSLPGVTRLERTFVQQVPLSTFESLDENDILFIDSTHVLAVGSDVQFEFLEILPRLRPGVIVHVHDIFFPLEYPESWVREHHRFWTEQYLLQAFLAFNDAFDVLFAAAWWHDQRPEVLRQTIPSYRRGPSSPGSLWMRKTR